MRKKVELIWHSFRYNYNSIILEDCLCNEMKTKIRVKRDYHSEKIKKLVSSSQLGENVEK